MVFHFNKYYYNLKQGNFKMAEIFKNYVKVANKPNTEYVIVPSGVINRNTTTYKDGSSEYNIREIDSDAQVHSLYISQVDESNRINGLNRYNPKNFKSVDLYIRDTSDENVKIYLAFDVRIVPGSPFYIEKNITLEPTQYLCVYCSDKAKDINTDANNALVSINTSINLNITASTVIFVDDPEI